MPELICFQPGGDSQRRFPHCNPSETKKSKTVTVKRGSHLALIWLIGFSLETIPNVNDNNDDDADADVEKQLLCFSDFQWTIPSCFSLYGSFHCKVNSNKNFYQNAYWAVNAVLLSEWLLPTPEV